MKNNKLNVQVKVPVEKLFMFTITPPNSTLWLPSTVKEETSEWPIQMGTVFTLTDKVGDHFEVTVTDLKENELVEWTATDNNYHCRYIYKKVDDQNAELEYFEWVDSGELDGPFTQGTLNKLKNVLEN